MEILASLSRPHSGEFFSGKFFAREIQASPPQAHLPWGDLAPFDLIIAPLFLFAFSLAFRRAFDTAEEEERLSKAYRRA
jgi:hypothetical protein